MEKLEKITRLIAYIGFLVMSILFIWQCNRNKPLHFVTDSTIHTDTIEKPTPSDTVTNYVIRWRTSTDTINMTDSIILIDSAKCLELAKSYYTTLVYNRTLVDDSLLTFKISDTVNQNQLQRGFYSYKINRPMQVISREKRFFGGVMTDLNGMSIVGGVNNANYQLFGGYDIIQKRFSVGLFRRF